VELGTPVIKTNYPIEVSITKDGKNKEHYRLIVKITPEKVIGRFKSIIKVPVLKPTGWKALEITVTGSVGATVNVIPTNISFSAINEKSIVKKFHLYLSGVKTAMEPELLTWSKIDGVKFKVDSMLGKVVTVIGEFSPDFIKSLSEKNEITFKFNYPATGPGIVSCKLE